ncbi:hypothetical protein LSTR_LSTR005776 [Laodelphax striatellus]|uniref:Odorant receptor n=1 Tax=Laodelphax striatellus TaxID=195883 RepID=A0A482X055_LAOST|nr:hypothetical protein LSTR_LSTR005776 [Laodelphax striatellus]
MFGSFEVLNLLMYICCLRPPEQKHKVVLYNIVSAFLFLVIICWVLVVLLSTITMFRIITNVAMFQVFLVGSAFMLIAQISLMMYFRKDLKELMFSIENKYHEEDDIHTKKLKSKSENMSLIILFIITAMIVLGLIFCVIIFECFGNNNMVQANTDIFSRENPEILLFYTPWLPFDYTVSPYYEILKIVIYFIITFAIPMAVLRLTTMTVLVIHVAGLFESIFCRMAELSFKQSENVEDKLIEIIKTHQHVIRISKNLVEFFRPIILLKAVFSFWMFAVLMVVITEEPIGSSIFINCAFCLLCSGYELLLDCWSGEQLARKSEKVGVAAYYCQWDRMSNSARKNLVLLTLRAQRPIQLEIRPYLIPMSLQTYVQIMKASFSCYTLLLSIKAEKH